MADPLSEATNELAALLQSWSFAGCFPGGYTGQKTVAITVNFPSDLVRNIEAESNGMLTQPLISVMPMPSPEVNPTLGSVDPDQSGVSAGKTRYSRTVQATFLVSCWADLQVGGGDMAQALAGQVWSAVFQNRNGLTGLRRLKAEPGHLVFNDSAQLWSCQLTVSGRITAYYEA